MKISQTDPITPSSDGPRFLSRAVEPAAWVLTFLMPLKFTGLIAVPEMPATYWASFLEIVLCQWPIYTFDLLAALLLGLCTLTIPVQNTLGFSKKTNLYTLGWVLLPIVSLLGIIHASTWDFYAQMIDYTFALACYAVSLHLLLCNRPGFAKSLLWAVVGGALLSLLSGFHQYWTGFQNTMEFLYTEGSKTGIDLLQGGMKTRLEESRVSADFAVCNVYAGYLATLLPVIFFTFWRVGNELVEPPKKARWILSIPFLLLMLFLLKETGSRGGLLALCGGAFLTVFCLKLPTRWRAGFLCTAVLGLLGFTWLVYSGRGFGSMIFRFDYYQAAFRMMLQEPLTGTGWGDFFHDYTSLKIMSNDEAPHTPHNMILFFGAQCGIPGFLLTTALLLLPCWAGIRALRSMPAPWKDLPFYRILVLTGAIVIWTIDTMMEVNFETPGSLVTAMAIAYLLLTFLKSDTADDSGPTEPGSNPIESGRQRAGFGMILLRLGCVGLVLFTFLHSLQMSRAELYWNALFEATSPQFARNEEQRKMRPDQIVQLLSDTVRYAPNSPFPWANAADYMTRAGYYADAERFLDEAIKRSPQRTAFHFRRYLLLYHQPGRRQEAMESLEKARKGFPGNPDYINPIVPKR